MPKSGKFVASIEARVGSSRLPGKVLKPIMGRPMLELMIERIKKSTQIDEVLVATTVNPNDDALEDLAKKLGVKCYRGSEEDVLLRVLEAAKSVGADHIVEMWGDTPLIDPGVIDMTVSYYKSRDDDYVAADEGFPWGTAMLVFPTKVLEEINPLATDLLDRENVSTYIKWHPEKYKASKVPCPSHLNRQDFRLTVDELPDFQLVSAVFEHFGANNIYFDMGAVIRFLDEHPEISSMNKNVKQRIPKPPSEVKQ